MSPKFQKFLAEARDDIQARRLIPQDEFWRRVEADAAESKRPHKKSKSKVKP